MAGRAHWNGYLKLSLVSCPVALSPATSTSERVSFRMVNKQTGTRVRYQHVDDVTREPVESEDRVKGYEFAKGEYLIVEDDELEAIQLESTRTIEIDSFVPAEQIDKRFYDCGYYISPDDKPGIEAFTVIREAMKGKGMVALGRVVMAKRERVIALEPHGKGLLGTTLRYPSEVRNAEEHFDDIPRFEMPAEMLKLAEHIIETKAADFEPSQFKDRYEEAVIALLKSKQAGVPPTKGKQTTAPRNVINLMDALRQSLAQEKPEKDTARRKPPAASGSRRLPARGRKSA